MCTVHNSFRSEEQHKRWEGLLLLREQPPGSLASNKLAPSVSLREYILNTVRTDNRTECFTLYRVESNQIKSGRVRHERVVDCID